MNGDIWIDHFPERHPAQPIVDPVVFDVDSSAAFQALLDQVPKDLQPAAADSRSLGELLGFVRPAHCLVEQGYFSPEGSFAKIRESNPALALSIYHGFVTEFVEEAWIDGSDQVYRDAMKVLQQLESDLDIAGLKAQVYPPRPTNVQRFLTAIGIKKHA